MTVFRGKKNSADIGRVVAFNGEPEMDVWDEDECNQFVGTDSTIFPPYLDVKGGVWAYEATICRSLGAKYVGKSKYMGVSTSEFDIDIGSEENTLSCFCRDYPDECPPKGFSTFLHLQAKFYNNFPFFCVY